MPIAHAPTVRPPHRAATHGEVTNLPVEVDVVLLLPKR
jgi:hypothetical protein